MIRLLACMRARQRSRVGARSRPGPGQLPPLAGEAACAAVVRLRSALRRASATAAAHLRGLQVAAAATAASPAAQRGRVSGRGRSMPAPRQPSAYHATGLGRDSAVAVGQARGHTPPSCRWARAALACRTSQTRWMASSASGATRRVHRSKSPSAASYSSEGSIAAVPRDHALQRSALPDVCQTKTWGWPAAVRAQVARCAPRVAMAAAAGPAKKPGLKERPSRHAPKVRRCPACSPPLLFGTRARCATRAETPRRPRCAALREAVLADCVRACAGADVAARTGAERERCAGRNARVCCRQGRGDVRRQEEHAALRSRDGASKQRVLFG